MAAELPTHILLQIFEKSAACLLMSADATDFTIITASNAYCRLTGLSRQQLIGKAAFNMFPDLPGDPSGANATRQAIMDAIATRHQTSIPEYIYHIPDPQTKVISEFWWSSTFDPLFDQDGKVAYVLGTAKDITGEVTSRRLLSESAAKLRAEQERLKRFFLQAPAGICILSGRELVFELVNPLYQRLFPERDLLGKPVLQAVPEVKGTPIRDILQHVLQTGETFEGNEMLIPLARADNSPIEDRYFNFIYQARVNEHHDIDGIIVFVIEVTGMIKVQRELGAANEELVASNEEFSAVNEELATANDELLESEERLRAAMEATRRSEHLFRSIALNIPGSLIIVIGHDHRFLAIEGDLMSKMGYNSKDYQGKHPLEVTGAERYAASKPLYDRVLAGESFSVERKAATGEDFMVHLVPLKNEQNKVYAGLLIALDITDIKQAEEKSAKLAAIVESSDDAIISKTFESVITSWNDSAERMFGYSAGEIIGETIYKLIPDDRQDEEPKILARLRSGERVEHFETKRLTKDGRLIDVSLSISPVRDKEGKVIGLSKIARDITERKLDETRKNDFIGMVSHELKTPLTSLGAIIQVVDAKMRNSEDPFLAGAMQKAVQQIKRMSAMINGFLNVSRLESGKIHIERQPFDLEALIEESLDETRLTLTTHEIGFEPCRPVMVSADRDKIASVLANLLSNAVKYSPKGKEIQVKCEVTGDRARVSISDEGMGIKPEDLPHVFDRYYRVANMHTQQIAGFGIGLYVSAEIIHRHDGEIGAESESGKGSTFYFSLPLL